MEKMPEELYKEREKRTINIAQLELPGMVPVQTLISFSSARCVVPSDYHCWFAEGEYMTADKYELFLDDK